MLRRCMWAMFVPAMAFAGITAFSQDAPKPEPSIDAKAEEVLQKAAAFYKELPAFKVEVTAVENVKIGERTRNSSAVQAVAAKRPNKLVLVSDENTPLSLYSDGETLTVVFDGPEVLFSAAPAPADYPSITDQEVFQLAWLGPSMLDHVLAADPYAAFTQDSLTITHVGAEEINGIACDKLRFDMGQVAMECSFGTGEKPLLYKTRADLAKAEERIKSQSPEEIEVSLDVYYDFNDWQLGEDVADSAFAFTPPAEAEKVDDVIASLRERAAAQEMASTGLEKGSAAPAFTLSTLDGGTTVSLADLKGKPIVLDFFASWCQWCYVGLPTIWEVSQEYADDGLQFYAVNLEETPELARQMLSSLKIEPPVLMDPDGKAGMDYAARGLPYTVVIDKDGNVANIHRGVLRDKNVYETMLRAEFDALVGRESK